MRPASAASARALWSNCSGKMITCTLNPAVGLTASKIPMAASGGRLSDSALTANAANGAAQLASHTAVTGGLGFGTDTSLYRSGAGYLNLDALSGGNPVFYLRDNGTTKGCLEYTGALMKLRAIAAGSSLEFATSNALALTLDSSQNAAFVGAGSFGASYQIKWTGRSTLKSPSDGIVSLLNNAETGFTRLQFGGTAATFPALKRNGTDLEAVLADDSAFASLKALNLDATTALKVNGVTRINTTQPDWTATNVGGTRAIDGGETNAGIISAALTKLVADLISIGILT